MIKKFHKIQAEAFKNYASKFKMRHKGDLLSLFMIWVESKDFFEKDKLIIWKLVKVGYPRGGDSDDVERSTKRDI